MIPKIIHFCWLSNDPYPRVIQNCLNTWKKHLPDYEIWLWDTKRFDINSTLWTQQAFANQKYAFAADYIRLYALFHYGGIYLDSDVLVYKSFNDLLSLPYFLGQDYAHSFEAAVIGAEKGMKWIGEILSMYENREFINEDGTFNMKPLPQVFYECLKDRYIFYKLHSLFHYEYNPKVMYIFDNDFFNSRNSVQVRRTKKSYCAHNYAGAWKSSKTDVKSKIKRILPLWILNIYFVISHHTFNKSRLGQFEPKFEN